MNLCSRTREKPEDWSWSEGPGRENSKNKMLVFELKGKLGNQGRV